MCVCVCVCEREREREIQHRLNKCVKRVFDKKIMPEEKPATGDQHRASSTASGLPMN